MEQGHVQVQRGFLIRRVEQASVRTAVLAQFEVKDLFDVGHLARHLQQRAVRVGCRHRQAFGLGELDHGLVVGISGPETGRELLGGEETAVLGTVGVVKLLQQALEFILVAQREPVARLSG